MSARRLVDPPAAFALPTCALAACALMALLAPAPEARAADALPESGWRTLTVGVLPVRSYVRGPDGIFDDAPEPARLRAQAEEWQQEVERALSALDLVELVPVAEATRRLTARRSYKEALALGRERYALGVERYRALATDDAVKQLTRASELFQRADASTTVPEELADAELYLGLAHLERGDRNLAHMAFRNMWLLDPGRAIERGYYPSATEDALAGALEDLATLTDKGRIRFPAAALSRLAGHADVDVWVMAFVEGSLEQPSLELAIFDARARALVVQTRVGLQPPESARDLLQRELSAWHACALESDDQPLVRRIRRARWYLDINYTHSLLLRHSSTRELFHSPGAGFSLTWESSTSLHVYTQFTQMASVPDANHDLLDTFVTSRIAVGAGLTGGSRRVRVFGQAGLEVAATGWDVETSTDVDCKHFGADHPRCDGVFVEQAPSIALGLAFGAGARFVFAGDWYATTRLDFTTFLAPADLVRKLNFPLGFSVGFGSRF